MARFAVLVETSERVAPGREHETVYRVDRIFSGRTGEESAVRHATTITAERAVVVADASKVLWPGRYVSRPTPPATD